MKDALVAAGEDLLQRAEVLADGITIHYLPHVRPCVPQKAPEG